MTNRREPLPNLTLEQTSEALNHYSSGHEQAKGNFEEAARYLLKKRKIEGKIFLDF